MHWAAAMPKIIYINKEFRESSIVIIEQANTIIADYAAQGYDLTLRQLYYQFVARGLLTNTDRQYKRLGGIMNDARLAGLIDWNAIQDRTRELRALTHWGTPEDIIDASTRGYRRDHWEGQPFRPEVWIEKDALIGVIEGTCNDLDVPYFSCRGYTSQSEMWIGARRMRRWVQHDQMPLVLHLGDHDPSGIDMTRDILDRLALLSGGPPVEVKRLALNMDQVTEYDPPPNPAKMTDSRYFAYTNLYGDESWELDALEPQVMDKLIRDAIELVRDDDTYQAIMAEEEEERERLQAVSDHWDEVAEFLEKV